MTDNTAPGVYTQPGGDADDDVLGHRVVPADDAPDFRGTFDKAAAHDDDAEGHLLTRDAAPGQRKAADDEDDVEGHKTF